MTTTPERRLAQRYELIAQANVASGDEAYLMPVRNVSTTGAYLEADPSEYPDLQPRVELEIVLSASAQGHDDEVVNVRCKGRVARVEFARPPRPGGFGLTIEPATAEDGERLEALIGRLAHIPPPRPASLDV